MQDSIVFSQPSTPVDAGGLRVPSCQAVHSLGGHSTPVSNQPSRAGLQASVWFLHVSWKRQRQWQQTEDDVAEDPKERCWTDLREGLPAVLLGRVGGQELDGDNWVRAGRQEAWCGDGYGCECPTVIWR